MSSYIFWLEDHPAVIKRSDLTGGNIISIINTNLVHPSLLVVHHDREEIFWVDTGTGKIERSDFDGRNRSQVWNNTQIVAGSYSAMDVYKVYKFN